jgi:hypothetical protein
VALEANERPMPAGAEIVLWYGYFKLFRMKTII